MRALAIVILGCVGCSSPASKLVAGPAPAGERPAAESPPAAIAEAPPAAEPQEEIEWNEIRSWDGLFVIGVPKSAAVNEYLMALVPIRGNADAIEFMVRIEKLPLTTQAVVAYEQADGATTKVKLDTDSHVQFVEDYTVEGERQSARHDVLIQRGKTLAVVWESVYRATQPAERYVAIQTEMSNRFRVEKTPP